MLYYEEGTFFVLLIFLLYFVLTFGEIEQHNFENATTSPQTEQITVRSTPK